MNRNCTFKTWQRLTVQSGVRLGYIYLVAQYFVNSWTQSYRPYPTLIDFMVSLETSQDTYYEVTKKQIPGLRQRLNTEIY